MKFTLEEFGELILAIMVIIPIIFILNRYIVPGLQNTELIKNIFHSLLGGQTGSGGI